MSGWFNRQNLYFDWSLWSVENMANWINDSSFGKGVSNWYFGFVRHISWIYTYMLLLKERSDGGGSISRLFECMSVRNIVTVTFRKMSFQLEFWKISNQIATFDLSRISKRLQQLPSIVLASLNLSGTHTFTYLNYINCYRFLCNPSNFTQAGNFTRDFVVSDVVLLISSQPSLQPYAVHRLCQSITASQEQKTLLQVLSIISQYCYLIQLLFLCLVWHISDLFLCNLIFISRLVYGALVNLRIIWSASPGWIRLMPWNKMTHLSSQHVCLC